MTAIKLLFTSFVAIGNCILASYSGGCPETVQPSLPTRARVDHIWRLQTMRCLFSSRMALHLTSMLATVHCSSAYLSTIKGAYPSVAVLLLACLTALDSFCHLPTVTSRLQHLLTCTTKSLMARSCTSMFTARHDITADLTTAPTGFIVCLCTLLRARLLSTEATLRSTHVRTGRTGTSMTDLVTRMRTLLRKHPFSSTCLPT